jgi:tryptophan-rich sensory protein/succinate dehydrogenase hydrophobic anchor subunit
MAIRLVRFGSLILFVIWIATAVAQADPAQGIPPPPAGWTQEQLDRLVDAISATVVAKLREDGKGVPHDGTPAYPVAAADEDLGSSLTVFKARAGSVLLAYPTYLREVARIPTLLAQDGAGRRVGAFVALLAMTIATALAAEALVRHAFLGLRCRLASRVTAGLDRTGLGSLIGLAVIGSLAVGIVWLVGYGAIGLWFSGAEAQSRFATLVLAGILSWRLYMLAFRLVVRPDLPGARLAVMADVDARALYRRILTMVLAIVAGRSLTRVLIAIHAPPEAIAAGQIVADLVLLAIVIAVIIASREAVRGWFSSLARPTGHSMGRVLAQSWHYLAVVFFVAVVATGIYGAIMERNTVPTALILTLSVIIALIFLQTVIAFVLRSPATRLPCRAHPRARALAISSRAASPSRP